MNAQSIAVHFADEVNRFRALTDEETEMLEKLIQADATRPCWSGRLWTPQETKTLIKYRRKGWMAPRIAKEMERTPGAIRSRIRTLKRREMVSG